MVVGVNRGAMFSRVTVDKISLPVTDVPPSPHVDKKLKILDNGGNLDPIPQNI